jgi:hypothetical protein
MLEDGKYLLLLSKKLSCLYLFTFSIATGVKYTTILKYKPELFLYMVIITDVINSFGNVLNFFISCRKSCASV